MAAPAVLTAELAFKKFISRQRETTFGGKEFPAKSKIETTPYSVGPNTACRPINPRKRIIAAAAPLHWGNRASESLKSLPPLPCNSTHIDLRVPGARPALGADLGSGIQPAAPPPSGHRSGRSVKALDAFIVGVERGLGVSSGREGHSHPLQLVAAALHKIQGNLRGRAMEKAL